MTTYTIIGNSQSLATGTTANVVQFNNPTTGTFLIQNPSTTVNAYVGIFSSNVQATFTAPTAGAPGPGVIIQPSQTLTISVNDGPVVLGGNVWLATITKAGSTTIYASPVSVN